MSFPVCSFYYVVVAASVTKTVNFCIFEFIGLLLWRMFAIHIVSNLEIYVKLRFCTLSLEDVVPKTASF